MKTTLNLILLLLSAYSQASSVLHYQDFKMSPASTESQEMLSHLFSELGYKNLVQDHHGLPKLGINQVYIKSKEKFVMVKHGIKGQFPLNTILTTPKGFLIHKAFKKENFFLYFRGFNREAVHHVLLQLELKVSQNIYQKIENIILPKAYAGCDVATGENLVTQAGDIQDINAALAQEMGMSCLTGLGQGTWDSTVGVLSDVKDELWEFAQHPINYVEAAADKIQLFLTQSADFMKALVTNPEEAMAKIGAGLGASWTQLSGSVSKMSTALKVQFFCAFMGSLGVDLAITLFTGGGASPKIAMALSKIAERFSRIGHLWSGLITMSNNALNRLKLSGKKIEVFMKEVLQNKIPDEDLLHLENLFKHNKDLSLETLSCYIPS
jgi:hypothetical protein